MALKLRPYQDEIINNIKNLMAAGQKSILVCSPTGSGKTALTAEMLSRAVKKGKKSFFNVHRRELIKQSLQAFEKADMRAGVISSGFDEDPNLPVQIASIQSLARRHQRYFEPDLIIWDECHHIAAGTWRKIFDRYSSSFHVGLTATPERLDGKGLSEFFNCMVKGPSVEWLISNEYLSDYKLFAPSTVSLKGVKHQMGDYRKVDLAEIMDRPSITGNAVKEYQKACPGKRAVVFCVNINHSMHVAETFNSQGVPAVHVDGSSSIQDRDEALRRFAAGEVKVLCNVDLFGEGFDLPSIEAAILLRPTNSLSLYLQQVGRALRPSPGKSHAIILDHVGNVQRHGLPDEDRSWSLLGKKARLESKSDQNHSVKICHSCFAAQPPGSSECQYCQAVFEKEERKILEVEGELSEIQKDQLKREKKRAQGQAQTIEDLYKIGVSRGYKHPRRWAKHVFQGRQAKKIRGVS